MPPCGWHFCSACRINLLLMLVALCRQGCNARSVVGVVLRWNWTDSLNASQQPVIRLGTALTLERGTRHAGMGLAMRRAYELYLEWLHSDRGGLMVGGLAHAVELVLIDDRSEAADAAWVTRRLIASSGVRLLLGPYSSGLSEAAAAVADELGAVMVAPCAGSPSVFAGRPHVFGTLPAANSFMVEAVAALAAAGARSVVSVREDASFMRGVCEELPRLTDLHGLDLGDQITLPQDAAEADVAAAVAALVADQPDVIVGCVYESVCHMLLRAIDAIDFEPRAIVLTTCVTERLPTTIGHAASAYTLGAVPWSKALQSTSTLAEGWTAASFSYRYFEKYGEEPPYQAASAFSAVAALVTAISQADSTEPLAVASQLASFDEPSIFGQLVFNSEGQSQNPVKVVQLQRSESPLLVAPSAVAEVPLVFPRPTHLDLVCLDVNNETLGLFGFDDDLVCVACAAGHLSRVRSLQKPDGSGPDLVRICEACPAGRRLVNDAVAKSIFCSNCSAGTEAPHAGMQQCTPCQPGRFQKEQGGTACELCAPGDYQAAPSATACVGCETWQGNGSAFQDMAGSLHCKQCPEGGLCEPDSGGKYSQFTSASGFYVLEVSEHAEHAENGNVSLGNHSSGEIMIFRCPHHIESVYSSGGDEDNACLARQTCRADPTTGEPASSGPFCGVCRPGYARADAAKMCQHCPEPIILLVFAGTSLLVIALILSVLLLSVRLRDALQPKRLTGIVLKQMINYFHMMSVVVSVSDMPQLAFFNYWVGLMKVILGVVPSEPAALASTCIFRGVLPGLSVSRASTLIGVFMMPAWFVFDLCGFYLYSAACSFLGRPRPPRTALVTVLVVTIFVIHPRVTRLCLQTFECRYFDVPRLLEQTDILCESSDHIAWQVVGFFGFLVFSCGVPVGLGLLLRKYHQAGKLYEPQTMSMLGFLYNGFEEEHYFTESWFMIRKALFQAVVLIPGLSATDPTTSSAVQNTVLLVFSISCLALHMATEPFDNRAYFALDRIETAMLWAVVVTCLAQTWLFVSDRAWLFNETLPEFDWAVFVNFRNTTCGAAVFFSHCLFWWRVFSAQVRETKFARRCPLLFPDDGEITIAPGYLDASEISLRARELLSNMLGEIAVMHVNGGSAFSFEKFVASLQATCVDAVQWRESTAKRNDSNKDPDTRLSLTDGVNVLKQGVGNLRGMLDDVNVLQKEIDHNQASTGPLRHLRSSGMLGCKCTVEELQLAMVRLRVSHRIGSYDRCDLDGFGGLAVIGSEPSLARALEELGKDSIAAPDPSGPLLHDPSGGTSACHPAHAAPRDGNGEDDDFSQSRATV